MRTRLWFTRKLLHEICFLISVLFPMSTLMLINVIFSLNEKITWHPERLFFCCSSLLLAPVCLSFYPLTNASPGHLQSRRGTS